MERWPVCGHCCSCMHFKHGKVARTCAPTLVLPPRNSRRALLLRTAAQQLPHIAACGRLEACPAPIPLAGGLTRALHPFPLQCAPSFWATSFASASPSTGERHMVQAVGTWAA